MSQALFNEVDEWNVVRTNENDEERDTNKTKV